MAGRKDKNTIDYFPHYCNSGKTLFVIENKYGNNGYAVLFKTFELLGNTENHFIDCRNIETWEYLQAKMKLMQAELQSIYDTLSNLGTIHKELWENKIIWSGNFLNNIKDVYKRRNSDCLQFNELCKHLSINCKHKYDSIGNCVIKNTQSKVKEIKEEDIKEEQDGSLCFNLKETRKIFLESKTTIIEPAQRLFKLSEEEVITFINEFFDWVQFTGEQVRSLHESKDHFRNWMNNKAQRNGKYQKPSPPKREVPPELIGLPEEEVEEIMMGYKPYPEKA